LGKNLATAGTLEYDRDMQDTCPDGRDDGSSARVAAN
jgi:hypothetical protein